MAEPLVQAIDKGDLKKVQDLLKDGANPDEICSESNERVIARAAGKAGKGELVKALIDAGANPNFADARGRTALMVAAEHGNAGAAKALIGAGASLGLADSADNTAYDWALNKKNYAMARELASSAWMPLPEPIRAPAEGEEPMEDALAFGTIDDIPGRTRLYARNLRLTGEVQAIMERMVKLEALVLERVQMSGLHLKLFSRLKGVKNLSLRGSKVVLRIPPGQQQDAIRRNDLEWLGGIPGLACLDLGQLKGSYGGRAWRVSDWSFLGRMRALEQLHLSELQIDDAALAHLRECRKLSRLSLAGSTVGDPCMDQLPRVPSLTELDMSRTRITDRGLVKLARLPNIKRLNLAFTPVSDVGIERLHPLPLTELDLRRTRVGKESAAVKKLSDRGVKIVT